MHTYTLLRRFMFAVAGAALSLAAGCSGNALSPSQSSAIATSSYRAPAGMRALPGPAVVGPVIVPLVPRKVNAPAGWPASTNAKTKGQLLFVADESTSSVLIYRPQKANSSPVGSITTGVDGPAGLAVDKSGALYVANETNSTVTVYAKGSSSPRLTISNGLFAPYGVAVDSGGNVFVSNLGTSDVAFYAAGSTTPYQSINFEVSVQPVGLGVDANNNLWVASDTTNQVLEIPAGTSNVEDSGLTSLNGPIGISFGQSDTIFVSNFAGSNVNIYAYGTTTPSGTITTGIEGFGPTLGGFTVSGAYFQTNQTDNVVGYRSGQTSPFSTLTGGTTPFGIASEPLITK